MTKYSRDGLPYLCLAADTESAPPAVDGAADPSTVERDNVEAATRDNTARSASSAVDCEVLYWHFVLGHTSVIKPKLYADGLNIEQKNRDLFCNICVMG